MSDYIIREEALDCLTGYVPDTVEECISRTLKRIRNIPAADVKPVVRAKWLTWEEQFPGRKLPRKKRLGVFCSNPDCRKHADNMTIYCPNCGARMEEDDRTEGT